LTAGPLRERIREIEKETGYLSPLQTILLLTDGSVTTLLEAISGDEVSVTTLSQVVATPGKDVASALEIGTTEMVNHRTVVLKNSRTGEALVYAVSYTPLLRLEPGFRDDLMRADTPIGKILKKHAIESRREILKIGVRESDNIISLGLGNRSGPFLFRSYKIIRAREPLMFIEEFFPASSFTGEQRVVIESPSRLHLGLIDLNVVSTGGSASPLIIPGRSSKPAGPGVLPFSEAMMSRMLVRKEQRKRSSPVSGSVAEPRSSSIQHRPGTSASGAEPPFL